MNEPIVERESLRRKLAGLESAAAFLGPYAEDHELILEWPPKHYQACGEGKRSEGAFRALRWLEEEIKRVEARLESLEKFPSEAGRVYPSPEQRAKAS